MALDRLDNFFCVLRCAIGRRATLKNCKVHAWMWGAEPNGSDQQYEDCNRLALGGRNMYGTRNLVVFQSEDRNGEGAARPSVVHLM